jgi:hypothetical protein
MISRIAEYALRAVVMPGSSPGRPRTTQEEDGMLSRNPTLVRLPHALPGGSSISPTTP